MTRHLSLSVWVQPSKNNPVGCDTKGNERINVRTDEIAFMKKENAYLMVEPINSKDIQQQWQNNPYTSSHKMTNCLFLWNLLQHSSNSDIKQQTKSRDTIIHLITSSRSPVSKSSSYQTVLGATAALDLLRCIVLVFPVSVGAGKDDLTGTWRKAIKSQTLNTVGSCPSVRPAKL